MNAKIEQIETAAVQAALEKSLTLGPTSKKLFRILFMWGCIWIGWLDLRGLVWLRDLFTPPVAILKLLSLKVYSIGTDDELNTFMKERWGTGPGEATEGEFPF